MASDVPTVLRTEVRVPVRVMAGEQVRKDEGVPH